ncbi:trans-aconitate methyltransferase [Desulfocarbo indianensis]|nr:trans-aconitate methyltransferase [Desulfocarbo indianensis]
MSEPPGTKWDSQKYEENAAYVIKMAGTVLKWLAPQPGERILDLGCGDGQLSLALAEAGAQVVAVDGSPEMIEAAQERGLDARIVPGQSLEFSQEFDAVFSNAALHWMHPHQAMLAGVARALKPGGRFVAQMGAHGCAAPLIVALAAVLELRGVDASQAMPWFFPTPDEYRGLLESHGFAVKRIESVPSPTLLPTGIEGWMDTFACHFLDFLPPEDRPAARDQAITFLRPAIEDRDGNWTVDFTSLRFEAALKGHDG